VDEVARQIADAPERVAARGGGQRRQHDHNDSPHPTADLSIATFRAGARFRIIVA
jgi:hypothetical protein